MIGTLWTGIVGLKAQQAGLENESNNISNVNTVGFKSSRVNFSEQLYASDMGHGTIVENLQKNFTQGSSKSTGMTYDMAIQGDGFFLLKKPGRSQESYTRAGDFDMSTNGFLSTQDGYTVQGYTSTSTTYQHSKDDIGNKVNDSDTSTTEVDYTIDGEAIKINNTDELFNDSYTNLVYNNIIKESTVNTVDITSTITRRSDYSKTATVAERINAERSLNQYVEAPNGVVVKLPDLTLKKENETFSLTVEVGRAANALEEYTIEVTAPSDGDNTNSILTDDQMTTLLNDISSKFETKLSPKAMSVGELLSDGTFTISDSTDINKVIFLKDSKILDKVPLSFNGLSAINLATDEVNTIEAEYSIIVDGTRYSYKDDPTTPTITDNLLVLQNLVDKNGVALLGAAPAAGYQVENLDGTTASTGTDIAFSLTKIGEEAKVIKNSTTTFTDAIITLNNVTTNTSTTAYNTANGEYELTVDGIRYTATDANTPAITNQATLIAALVDSNGNKLSDVHDTVTDATKILDIHAVVGSDMNGSKTYEKAVVNLERAGARMLQTNTLVTNSGSVPGDMDLNLKRLTISENPYGDFSVNEDGEISVLQNGATIIVGKLAIARFSSNTGLDPIGNNQYLSTLNSGRAILATESQMPLIQGKALEMSNADLSEGLINMIVYQRAFEANAKTITTSDQLLTTLLGMKR
jgi:flagellar hook protein FlgE